MLYCANEREIISFDGNYRSDFYRHAGILSGQYSVFYLALFAIYKDEIHLRFWINAAHYCSSNLQKLTQESERQIGDFISQKTLSHVASADCNLKSFDFDHSGATRVYRPAACVLL
jgi:hypothetical protein